MTNARITVNNPLRSSQFCVRITLTILMLLYMITFYDYFHCCMNPKRKIPLKQDFIIIISLESLSICIPFMITIMTVWCVWKCIGQHFHVLRVWLNLLDTLMAQNRSLFLVLYHFCPPIKLESPWLLITLSLADDISMPAIWWPWVFFVSSPGWSQ